MSNIAIKVENLSKIYRLGEIGTGTISRDMERWFKTRILKQEDPFLKIGETNDRANKGASDIVYSLQDINFEINQGDAVGIIGRNGAGKSTLLKILSRVTTPTTGKINIKGRVASLLEVGTGFHPELTGRENIYLNGAILGMRKREIDRKLDEIIDFSGVERYIDTPVKRYSSGMYVRLAFAVAAHLESEILIVDEVLAVGDAEFQKKCLGKMGEVSKGEGRTVLFVSHNMGAVSKLCNKGVLLKNGKADTFPDIHEMLKIYSEVINDTEIINKYEDEYLIIDEPPFFMNRGENEKSVFKTDEEIEIGIVKKYKTIPPLGYRFGFDLLNEDGEVVFRSFHDDNKKIIMQENTMSQLSITIPKNLLKEGNYTISFLSGLHNIRWLLNDNILLKFQVINSSGLNSEYNDYRPGFILPMIKYKAYAK
jgi:lipopolysaccharide transport system ATP-binding protein